MFQGKNRRLANVKTRRETGFDYVVSALNLQTPFGIALARDIKPFFPGQEAELKEELSRVAHLMSYMETYPADYGKLTEAFMVTKDLTGSIGKSRKTTLSEVEIFEIKSMLLNTLAMRRILYGDARDAFIPKALCHTPDEPVCGESPHVASGETRPASTEGKASDFASAGEDQTPADALTPRIDEEFIPLDTEELLDILDPRKDRINTFYIYDDFSDLLREKRLAKRETDKKLRRIQKKRREMLRKATGIGLTPKFDIVMPRSSDLFAAAASSDELEKVTEDYVSVTFALKENEETYALAAEAEALNEAIETEEERVREDLTAKIASFHDILMENCRRIGRLDFVSAKARFALDRNCTEPEIVSEHIVDITDGRQPEVEEILLQKGKTYMPISIKLTEGVSCITGANMGGKTISLKLAGLVPLLTQYGYFVPCAHARVGLSNFIRILIGDSQSVERGLSSFGSEMEELNEILTRAQDRSVVLIDEIASGTNPAEGTALTKSLVDYLLQKPYITLLTTHFEALTEEERVNHFQVMGLRDADFTALDRELRYANRRVRIDIISKYMDYRLVPVESASAVPRDALNIAKMLGINKEIIEGAQKYL